MITMEKAYKIRNLYNSWKGQSQIEAVCYEKLYKLGKELEKATYSKNGYEYFQTFGAWLSEEEVNRQKDYLVQKQEMACKRMKTIEEKIEQLMQTA